MRKASTQRTLVVARVVNTKEGQRDNAFQLQVLVHEVVRTCYHVYRVKVLVVQHQVFQFGETGQFIARQTAADKLLVQFLAYFIGQTAFQHEERRRAIFTDNIITVVYQQFGTDSKLFLAVLLLLRPSVVLTVRVAVLAVRAKDILIRSAERFNLYGKIEHIFIEVRTDNRDTVERAVPDKRMLHHVNRFDFLAGKVLVCLINAVLGQFYQAAICFCYRRVGRYHCVWRILGCPRLNIIRTRKQIVLYNRADKFFLQSIVRRTADIDIDINILRKLIPKFQFQITGMRVECAAFDFCCLRVDDWHESNHHAKAQEQRNYSAD